MARIPLLVLITLIGLGSAGLLWGSPGDRAATYQTVAQSVEKPQLSAASAQIRKQRLILKDLQPIEEKAANQKLAGRVLISCSPWVNLGLWTVVSGRNMARATPFLGYEGPGTTFLKTGARGGEDAAMPLSFKRPVPVTLIYLSPEGAVVRTRTVLVKELEAR